MEKPKIRMKHSMEHYGIESQDLWDINSLKWVVLDAVVHFNIGNLATLLIYDKMGMERGFYTMNGCLNENTRRIKNANRKDTESVTIRRRLLRGARKCKSDKSKKKQEGSVHDYGKF